MYGIRSQEQYPSKSLLVSLKFASVEIDIDMEAHNGLYY